MNMLAIALMVAAGVQQGISTPTTVVSGCAYYAAGQAHLRNVPACDPVIPEVTLETARQKKDKLEPPKYEDWSVWNSSATSSSFSSISCAGGKQLPDGSCELTITFPAEYKDLVCTEQPRRHDEPYVYKCTWKEASK